MFDNLTSQQMVDIFNAAQVLLGRDSSVKKFADKKTGLARLERARAELVAMHGHAELVTSEQGIVWSTERPTSGRRTTTLDLAAPLTVLAAQNPKRAGSKSRNLFELYAGASTGAEYIERMVAAGYTRKLALSALHWDIQHGYIRLGSAE